MAREWAWRLAISVAALAILGVGGRASAIALNDDGTINLSMRAYVNARIGTMAKQCTQPPPRDQPDRTGSFGGTFPCSGAGHLMQNRYFLEVEWDQDLLPWVEDYLPEWVTSFEYTLSYRGEYEGIYDFGPKEYSHSTESQNKIETFLRQSPTFAEGQLQQVPSMLQFARHRLRQVASYRNRLFQAFLDFEIGDLFVRFGRQNLVWGETDVFRLLDNINPIDNSFGGFFIDLDERRVPLDMLRASYFLGTYGPFDQVFLEGYAAYDKSVAFVPGAPFGSPWSNPLGPPTGQTLQVLHANPESPDGVRGGGRLVFNVSDFTFTLASYFTILDFPAVRFRAVREGDPDYQPAVSVITADLFGPRVWVNGASMTTAFPELKSVLRGEFAWFRDEALFRGATPNAFPLTGEPDPIRPGGLPIPGGNPLDANYQDNFLFRIIAPAATSLGPLDTVTRKDSLNFSIGWDMNQYIRFLNPAQTFFFTTQFFARKILDPAKCTVYVDPTNPAAGTKRELCQALPVRLPNNSTRQVPIPASSFLHTLLVNTTYNHNIPFTDTTVQTTPGFGIFYDWQGMFVFQPSVRFVRDPWRFIVDYTTINSGVYRYQFGLVRDRSNVRFQIEYVL